MTSGIRGGNLPARHRLARTWGRLTEPHSSIKGVEKGRRARVLSGLLVATLSLGVFALLLTIRDLMEGRARLGDVWLALIPLILLAGAYALSRSRHSTLAAGITLAILIISTFAAAVLEPRDSIILAYVLLPGLVSSLLFSPRTTVAVFAGTLVGVLGLPILQPSTSSSVVVAITLLVLAAGSLMAVATAIRNQDLGQMERPTGRLCTAGHSANMG